MATANTAALVAQISLQTSKFEAGQKRVESGLSRLESRVSKAGRGFSILGGAISTAIGVGVERAISSGIGLLTSSLKEGVAGLEKLELANNQTQAALKATGGAAGVNASQIRNLAEKYEGLNATIDDKVIQANENLLLSFKNIKGPAFEGTLKAALDLNKALSGGEEGLQGVIVRLGRAMNDPAKGLALLARSGISLDAKTTKTILTLQKQNKLFDAQKILLDALATRYGGRFAAAGDTAAGKAAKLSDALEDLKISFASTLAPAISNVRDALLKTFTDPRTIAGVQAFGSKIASFLTPENIQKGIGVIKDTFVTLKGVVTNIPWAAIGTALKIGGQGAKLILDAFASAPSWLQTAVVTGWGFNKLTGGLAGNLFGGLFGKGLDVVFNRGSTPVNPMFTKEVGVGDVGAPAAGGGGGVLAGVAKWVLGPAAAIAIGKEIAQALNAPTIGPAKEAEAAAFDHALKSNNLDSLNSSLKAINDQLNTSDASAQVALIASRIPYIGDALGNVAPELERQRDAIVAAINAEKEKIYAANLATGRAESSARARAQAALARLGVTSLAGNSAIRSTAATTHARLSTLAGIERGVSGNTAAIAKKNFSPRVNVNVAVTSNVTISDIQRKIQSQQIAIGRGLQEGY